MKTLSRLKVVPKDEILVRSGGIVEYYKEELIRELIEDFSEHIEITSERNKDGDLILRYDLNFMFISDKLKGITTENYQEFE